MTTTGAPVPRKLANAASRHGHHTSLSQLPGQTDLKARGASPIVGHANAHVLPRLETQGLLGGDMASGLRTAPPLGGFPLHFEMDGLYSAQAGSTINPAQLHLSESPQPYTIGTPTSPYNTAYSGVPTSQSATEQEDALRWINSFDAHVPFAKAQEYAVAESSPSALSTASQSAMSDVMLDGSNFLASGDFSQWPQTSISPPSQMIPSTFSMDLPNPNYADIIPPIPPPPGTVSPKSLHEQFGPHDPYFSGPPPVTVFDQHTLTGGTHNQLFHPPMVFNPGSRSASSEFLSGTGRQMAAISACTDSITEMTRQALITDLSRASLRRESAPGNSALLDSSLITSGREGMDVVDSITLPGVQDLQRYVAAYIQYFHPHLPFLHFPTLSFDPSVYGDGNQVRIGDPGYSPLTPSGAGCLLLAMAAAGAFYEFEPDPSRELFQAAKHLTDMCLEGCLGTDALVADGQDMSHPGASGLDTPLPLLQALLLTVLYGYNCGDRTASDSANAHWTRLIELARGTRLTIPRLLDNSTSYGNNALTQSLGSFGGNEDIPMGEVGMPFDFFGAEIKSEAPGEQLEWHSWKVGEERKRTLFAIFILSSMLVSTYNHAPALTNSEIKLDLPCDEDLWAAENAQAWYAQGGAIMAGQTSLPFSVALGALLSASHRQSQQQVMNHPHQPAGASFSWDESVKTDIKPGTFGCLVLINALHNYIWETRQRHHGRQWMAQETEAMHAHIEPALKAWHAAWASDPHHSLGRPNPFGKGPLSADSVPLLDLAYVRLYVDFGRSKEAFFERDFDTMVQALAGGSEVIQHGGCSPSSISTTSDLPDSLKFGSSPGESPTTANSSPDLDAIKPPTSQHPPFSLGADDLPLPGQPSKRERYLRKAAYHAADSLALSDKVGVTFASFDSRELPLQSALCAFDCAQALAEWLSVLQARVGQYLGISITSRTDRDNARRLMVLEDEDCVLLEKIAQIVQEAEIKMATEVPSGESASLVTALENLHANDRSYGSKILSVTAYMLDRAAVWPGEYTSGSSSKKAVDRI